MNEMPHEYTATIALVSHGSKTEATRAYSETRRLSGGDELNVSRHGVLTDARLHPGLTQFVAGLYIKTSEEELGSGQTGKRSGVSGSSILSSAHFVDGHPGFKVVHAAEDQVHWRALLQPPKPERT